MNQLKTMLKWEVILQSRYRIIHLAIASVVLYYLALRAVPLINTSSFRTMFLFFDPITIGIVFAGALVLFEKTENTLQALVVTPMAVRNYFLAKIISLTTLAFVSSLLFTFLVHGFEFNYIYMSLGIVLTSVFLILLGFVPVSRCTSLNEYLLRVVFSFLVLFIPPILYAFGLFENALVYLFPSQATFVLLEGVFVEGAVTLLEAVYAVGYLAFWTVLSYYLAKRAFHKNIVMGEK